MKHKDTTISVVEFNSRTTLCEKGQDDKPYDPFDHRDKDNGSSTAGALIHLLKSSLGTGILAMPMAFKNGGLVFASVGTIIIGFLCTHCVYALVKTSHEVCAKSKQPSLGFAETAETVFMYGPNPTIRKMSTFARYFVDIGMSLTYFAGCCVYIVFIATTFREVINYYIVEDTSEGFSTRTYILITIIPVLLIGQIRELKYLVPFSATANLCLLVSFSITLYYLSQSLGDRTDLENMGQLGNLPMFFSTVIFAMEGIGVVMPVENSMKKPQQFLGCPGVLNVAMGIVVALYAILGFFGYMKYGTSVAASVTENLPVEEIPAQVVKVLIGLAVLFTFGLQFYVPSSTVWSQIQHRIPKNRHNLMQVLLRSVAILLMMGLALAVPELEPFIGLVGAVFFSILGFLVPCVVETIHRWDGQLGFAKWVLWKNLALSAFAMFALIAGSFVSIEKIVEIYTK